MSAKEFRLGLDRWFKDEVEDRIVLAIQKIGIQALRSVVLKSPVDTGRFRGNWLVAIGTPDQKARDRVDKPGEDTIREGSTVITGLSEATAIYLTNNLPYAVALENGHSQQAPGGMVAVTMAELETFFARID